MKKFLLGLTGVLMLACGALALFVRVAGRDAPPPDETEFMASRPDVAPEDNAFTYFIEATNRLVDTTNDMMFTHFRMGKTPATDELREWLAQNAECLALVKRGTQCAVCLMPPVETIEIQIPHLNPWLHMQRILEARTRLARLDGRFADAADDVATGLRFGHLVQRNASCLIVYLVGVALSTSSADSAMELARDPSAPPEILARLAAELEMNGPFVSGLIEALKTEYRMAANVVDDFCANRDQTLLSAYGEENPHRVLARLRNLRYFFKPNQTKLDLAASYRIILADVGRLYADMELLQREEKEVGRWAPFRPNAIGNYIHQLMTPSATLLDVRCRTDGILAGTKLVVACKRFERDKGRRPETLAELVPDYLSDVPPDPYDGEPFRYSAEKGIVWAVGTNLKDEGGSTKVPDMDETGTLRSRRHRAEDFVFEL